MVASTTDHTPTSRSAASIHSVQGGFEGSVEVSQSHERAPKRGEKRKRGLGNKEKERDDDGNNDSRFKIGKLTGKGDS